MKLREAAPAGRRGETGYRSSRVNGHLPFTVGRMRRCALTAAKPLISLMSIARARSFGSGCLQSCTDARIG
jgi:hypothetical protein